MIIAYIFIGICVGIRIGFHMDMRKQDKNHRARMSALRTEHEARLARWAAEDAEFDARNAASALGDN